jgi:hydrogenase maturation factor
MSERGKGLPTGKIPTELLADLLARHASGADARILVPPRPGEDAAVLEPSGDLLVVTTDPITFVSEELGWYAVQVNANDIAAMGGDPEFFLLALLLPEGETAPETVERILEQTSRACGELGIALVGGHTEVTPAVRQPVAVGQMLGRVPRGEIRASSGARPGEDILVTRGFPVEGVSVVAELRRREVGERFGEAFLERCLGFVHDPGIGIVGDARALRQRANALGIRLGAFHDPTEGGLATGLREVAEASGVGLVVDAHRLPLLPEARRLCEAFGLDPLGVIASGTLIATCEGGAGERLAQALRDEGIPCWCIGRTTRAPELLLVGESEPTASGRFLLGERAQRPLPRFPADEVTRLL